MASSGTFTPPEIILGEAALQAFSLQPLPLPCSLHHPKTGVIPIWGKYGLLQSSHSHPMWEVGRGLTVLFLLLGSQTPEAEWRKCRSKPPACFSLWGLWCVRVQQLFLPSYLVYSRSSFPHAFPTSRWLQCPEGRGAFPCSSSLPGP